MQTWQKEKVIIPSSVFKVGIRKKYIKFKLIHIIVVFD